MNEHRDNSCSATDPGLIALVMLLRIQGVGVDPEQVRHQFRDTSIGVPEMLRCAKSLGLRARASTTNWTRLAENDFTGARRPYVTDAFCCWGKVGDDKIIVQEPNSPRPIMMTRAELESAWDGQLVLMTKRAMLSDLARRFDVTWFLGAIHKYRRLLSEVLVASFFLQLFALVSPLFFQVVVDKVLVHRSMSTLDVLAIGLVAIALFETVLGVLRTYLFSHTTNRIDVELGARLFRHLLALPISYFQARRVGDSVAPRARTGEHPQLPDQLGSDPGHRPVLHDRLHCGLVRLLAAADLDRARIISAVCRNFRRRDAVIPATARRKIPTRRRKPSLPGRKRSRHRNTEGDGGRAANAAALGGAHWPVMWRRVSRFLALATSQVRRFSS